MISPVESKPVTTPKKPAPKAAAKPQPNPKPQSPPTPPASVPRSAQGNSGADFRAGTYNLAAGNATYSQTFDRSKRLAAQQVVSGGVDVLATQEVGINGKNTRGRDNNEELLQEIFRQELPPEFRDASIDRYSLDANGETVMRDGKPIYDPQRYADSRYTATNESGQTQNMTLTRDRYDTQGREVPFSTSAGHAPTVLYSAHLEEEDKTYNLAFASNNDHGSYGNSVLLGPGDEIEDVQERVLGKDPDDEQRSALAVSFRTPDGQEATAISAHLSNGSSQAQGDARIPQLRNLSDWARGYDNAVILGDFNTYPGKEYGKQPIDLLPFVDPDKTPSASSFGLQDPDRGVRSIDRVFTQGDVGIGPRRELDGQGGSDHDMVTWDVDLLDALRQNYALAS